MASPARGEAGSASPAQRDRSPGNNQGRNPQLVYAINRTATDPSVYPVFLASYFIACPTYDDKATADIVKGFGQFVVSDLGQKAAATNALSAPLPSDVASKADAVLAEIAAK